LESLPPDTADMKDTVVEVHSNENHIPVPHNQSFTTQNTLESFQAMDRQNKTIDVKNNPKRILFS